MLFEFTEDRKNAASILKENNYEIIYINAQEEAQSSYFDYVFLTNSNQNRLHIRIYMYVLSLSEKES